MSDLEKMKEVEARINSLLEQFNTNKITKSQIMKYYQGLDMTYDEFLERLESLLVTKFSEEESIMFEKIMRDF